MGGLPESVREQDLKEYCRRWGSIVDIVVMSGRGFGFVTFAMEDHARAFCEHKQHRLGGRLIDVQFAVPRPEQPPPTREKAVPYTSSPGTALKLFIGGIPEVRVNWRGANKEDSTHSTVEIQGSTLICMCGLSLTGIRRRLLPLLCQVWCNRRLRCDADE